MGGEAEGLADVTRGAGIKPGARSCGVTTSSRRVSCPVQQVPCQQHPPPHTPTGKRSGRAPGHPSTMPQNVVLQGPAPWGFRLSGGIDFNQPLIITRVRTFPFPRCLLHFLDVADVCPLVFLDLSCSGNCEQMSKELLVLRRAS